MHESHHPHVPPPEGRTDRRQSGQALVEYVLIVVLVAIIFGVALAATGDAIGNVFSNSVDDLVQNEDVTLVSKDEFWQTVTAAFLTPLVEVALPTNTPAPPTSEPTDGPSPTPTEIVPTKTPLPTKTPTLTSTPKDKLFELEYYDSIETNTFKNWRADSNVHLYGINDPNNHAWYTQFYDNMDLTAPIGSEIPGLWKVDLSGNEAALWGPAGTDKQFSARFSRTLNIPADGSYMLRLLVDDGARVKVDGTTQIEQFGRNGPAAWFFKAVSLTAGDHLFEVEYKQNTGDKRIMFLIQSAGGNPDDVAVDAGGIPASTPFGCGWGQNFRVNGNDANTELGMWDEFYVDDTSTESLPKGSRCHLELRGAVNIPLTAVNPQLIFWDVWDLKTGTTVYLEVSEYVQATDPLPGGTPAPIPSLNRGELNWRRVNLHSAGTKNYNFSRQVVNLKELPGDPLDFSKPITFRFVIQNTSYTGQGNRWYIDDVLVRDEQVVKNFKLDTPAWNLDGDDQMNDFVFTGGKSTIGHISGWRLTSNNKLGPGGMAFHDSVGPSDNPAGVGSGADAGAIYTQYKRNTEQPNDTDPTSLRYHTLEFNGWIDLDPTVEEDAEGNRGDPALTFYQGYDVGSLTGLEVQWTADDFDNPNATWSVFADGLIRDVNATGTITNTTLQERVVSMADLPGNPAKIRVRFVMKVHTNAVRRDGWWIDQIRIGREETPKWLDYPFTDNAQYFTGSPWRFQGKWALTNLTGRRNLDEPTDAGFKRQSYASSPGGNYDPGQDTWMEGRYAVDLFNDTQTDPGEQKVIWGKETSCAPTPCTPPQTSNTGGAALNPILSFYHFRDLGTSDNFYVEWKRVDAPASAWKKVWMYKASMATNPSSPSSETLKQKAWEYVEIDLADVMTDVVTNNTADVRDDDIVFRFMLDANSVSVGTGIYIDDIKMLESSALGLVEHRLWPATENRDDPITGTNIGNGNGIDLYEDSDASTSSRLWTTSYFAGGDWFPMGGNGGAYSGTSGFHDSPIGGQDKAPDGVNGYTGEPGWVTASDRFAVLELNNIIDLRTVDAVTDAPVLYFWTRYHVGGNNKLRVEISEAMVQANGQPYDETYLTNDIKTRCKNEALRQCYEQRRGWKPWTTAPVTWSVTATNNSEMLEYGWERAEVDLSSFAYNSDLSTPGKRIRIRFVYDSLAANTNPKDGWYVDGVQITYRLPGDWLPATIKIIDGAYDNQVTKGMFGMVGEGKWGLDPNIYEGSGSAPTSFGTWKASWWNCSSSGYNCKNYAGGNYKNGVSNFLELPPATRPAPTWTNNVIGLNYNMSGPPPGSTGIPNDYFAGEFTLDTPAGGAPGFPIGSRTMLLESDDGVRAKIRVLNADGSLGQDLGWNIVNNWKDQSPTTVSGTMTIANGVRYQIMVQYYENTSGAVLRANISEGKFSYSDSPRLGDTTTPDVYPIPYANTSLMVDQILDLEDVDTGMALLIYRTKYRLGGKSNLWVEISQDGGFTWTKNNLSKSEGGFSMSSNPFNNAVQSPSDTATSWQQRIHNLNSYKGSKILIRFRYDRLGEYCLRTKTASGESGTSCDVAGGTVDTIAGYYDGWWISRITVGVQ